MFKVYFPLKKIYFNKNTFVTKTMHFSMHIHNFTGKHKINLWIPPTKKYAVGNRVKEYVVKSNRHGNYMELFLIQLMVLCMVPIRFDEIGSLFNIFKEFDTAYRRVALTPINKCCATESADMNHKLLVDYS